MVLEDSSNETWSLTCEKPGGGKATIVFAAADAQKVFETAFPKKESPTPDLLAHMRCARPSCRHTLATHSVKTQACQLQDCECQSYVAPTVTREEASE